MQKLPTDLQVKERTKILEKGSTKQLFQKYRQDRDDWNIIEDTSLNKRKFATEPPG